MLTQLKTKTVVVVDDSDFVRKILGFSLKKAGYTALSEVDGKEALKLFDGKEIDLVITDLNMPNMDGLTLIKAIRAIEYYKYIPIVLFSDSEKDIKHFIETSGATSVFDKNNINEKLIPTVKKMIG